MEFGADWAGWMKLVHVGIAFALVAGLVGRWILLTRAAASEDVEGAYGLSKAASPFERMVQISGSAILPAGLLTAWIQGYDWLGLTTGWMLLSTIILLSTLPLVPLIFIPRGRVFEAAMETARERGTVTPELRAAWRDPAVAFARRYELAAVAIVIVLMVLKPFG
ncbi:MAG TPA: DUF2269 family protein [Candidatus Limnocylindria bacterium]|nr:DUF2269 family protein [Candidatus Limnocylindria bacterium]